MYIVTQQIEEETAEAENRAMTSQIDNEALETLKK